MPLDNERGCSPDLFRRFGLVSMLSVAIVGVLLITSPLAAQRPGEERETLKPIATGEGYFVHVQPADWNLIEDRVRRVYPGFVVTRTDRRTGEMTCLQESGTFKVPTRRISYFQRRLLGVVVGEDRLYVASWSSGRIWDKPPNPWEKITEGWYEVDVFRLSDGKRIDRTTVKEGTPDVAPREPTDVAQIVAPQAETGKLELSEQGGVKLFGQQVKLRTQP